ncbi:MAG: 50S ribosomal protein L25 [Cyanobacteria bacterium P01_G01_bin.54]
MSFTLECKQRPEGSKPRALRREGWIPANLYGHKGAESVHLVVDQKEADTLMRKVFVNKSVIDLKIPDLSWEGNVVIHEAQTHPWKGDIYHLSFFVTPAAE